MNKQSNTTKTSDWAEFAQALKNNPAERERMNKSWERMTKNEAKKGPAGQMTAMFMKAIRF